MPARSITSATVAILLLTLADSANALRCGSRLVTDGMHISEVLRLCGEPVAETERLILVTEHITSGKRRRIYQRDTDGRYVQRSYGHFTREVVVTELTYNFGPNRLMRLLTFRDGWLDDVDTLGYGYHD